MSLQRQPRAQAVCLLATACYGIGFVYLRRFVSPRVVVSILIPGMAGTGLADVWNTNSVAAWGAANATTATYLTPIVGVGVAEPVTWQVEAVVVITGMAISQGRLDAVGNWRRWAALGGCRESAGS